MAFKITRLRVAFFDAMGAGSPLTFREILTACGVGSEHTRGDYIRVHQFVMGFVKQGILLQQKVPRHGYTTFALSPAGRQLADSLLGAYEARVRRMAAWSPAFVGRLPPSRLPARAHGRGEGGAAVPGGAPTEGGEGNEGGASHPMGPAGKDVPSLQCPHCGKQQPAGGVEALLAHRQKIWCDCGENLTPLAWAIFDPL